jgi:hypothetical protein
MSIAGFHIEFFDKLEDEATVIIRAGGSNIGVISSSSSSSF